MVLHKGETAMRSKSLKVGLVVGLLLLISVTLAFANRVDLDIAWKVLANGGGSSSGGEVALDSTLGQPITGNPSSGEIYLTAGYWVGQPLVRLHLPLITK